MSQLSLLSVTNLATLSLSQVSRTTPELAPLLQTSTPREDFELDRLNMYQSSLHGRSSVAFGLEPTKWLPGNRLKLISSYKNSPPLEIACSLGNPKVVGSTPAGGDRFYGCENRSHTCYMIMWHVKVVLSINLALVLPAKLNHGNIPHPMKA
ncbi:hypothetical protein TNCV_82471 [Trichonephila clavipes]|nr:hypothetical protein TNCV_82471 [Trichonephila clavipes]